MGRKRQRLLPRCTRLGRSPLLHGHDRNITTALTTRIPLWVFHDLRAAVAGITTLAVFADDPVVRLGVLLAMTIRRQRLDPLLEGRAVISRSTLVLLLDVDQFVANRPSELRPSVFLVGVP